MIRKSLAKLLAAVIFALFALSAANAADLRVKFTDKSKLKYEGDWSLISYQAYTSKYVGKGARKGTVTCKPNLTGTYQIITEYKATVNRGNKALYYVDGAKVKEINQGAGTVNGKSAFQKVSLGVFELKPDSAVELRAQDGKSYSFVGFTFTTSTEKPSDVSSGDGSVEGDTAAESSFVAKKDGDMIIEPYLSTYSPATFKVLVDGKEVFSWVRSNDSAKEPCVVQGAADEKSMVEQKAGDFSPASGLKYTVALKAGQKVTSSKSGNFEAGSYLKISGPFDGEAAAPAAPADADKTTDGTADDAGKTGAKTGSPATTDTDKPASMDDVLKTK